MCEGHWTWALSYGYKIIESKLQKISLNARGFISEYLSDKIETKVKFMNLQGGLNSTRALISTIKLKQ